MFDVETFVRGLTQDVRLYNTERETQPSTILNDIFPDRFTSTTTDSEKMKRADEVEVALQSDGLTPLFEVKRLFTLSQFDCATDNIDSRQHVILMWLVLVFSYFSCMLRAGSEYNGCDITRFWCKLVNAIIIWLQIMVNLVIAETFVGCSVSMGNGEFSRNLARLIVGILSVG